VEAGRGGRRTRSRAAADGAPAGVRGARAPGSRAPCCRARRRCWTRGLRAAQGAGF
jgi:hypothetical protein